MSCSESWISSGCIFDVPGKTARLAALEELAAAPEFWGDPEKAQKALKEQSDLRQTLGQHAGLVKELEDVRVLLELAVDHEDVETLQEVSGGLTGLTRQVRTLELQTRPLGRVRQGQRHPEHQPRRRRHGVPGLGPDAPAHVPALGRGQGFQDRDH